MALSTYTFAEGADEVLEILAAEGSRFFTIDQAKRQLRRASDTLSLDTRWFRGWAYGTPQANRGEYLLPECVYDIRGVYYQGYKIYPMAEATLDAWNDSWRTITPGGTPLRYLLRGLTSLVILPTPSVEEAENALVVEGYALPPRPTADADKLYVPRGWEEAPLYIAAAKMAQRDKSEEGQARYAGIVATAQDMTDSLKKAVADNGGVDLPGEYNRDGTLASGELPSRVLYPFELTGGIIR